MPNHITNKIRLTGDQKRIDELLQAVKYEEKELGTLDFNKLLPIPESLNMTAGSIETKSVEAYLTAMNPDADDYGVEKLAKKEFEKLLTGLNSSRSFGIYHGGMSSAVMAEHASRTKEKSVSALISLGKQYADNFRQYGCTTWYNYRVRIWGSKWNSCCPEPLKDNTITFSTAWSRVTPVLEKLSELYPDLEMEYSWADEDIGTNVGIAHFSGGGMTEEYLPEVHSKEAFEMAAEIRGCSLSEYGLIYSGESGTYEFHDNDAPEMEVSI